ncbi:hypothetical protein BKK54_03250 [Rodentibacter genomosp. 1]|uniref:Uncharacterized protein n=1 Tax=Rodentibacter genomosp. 1 TaxID=1908264 RepID=A0A1V3J835_9PAST|nr:hypothetical protein [Rodentibacter genomosp. 1]OOF51317.1 hypothetical protein BKK54_03250 [Rodentibacter genomosp. 1]
MPNEVKITPALPYSTAVNMFTVWISIVFQRAEIAKLTELINLLQINWLLFDSESREYFICQFQSEADYSQPNQDYHRLLTDFITWAINPPNQSVVSQPLNAFVELPVVKQARS